MSHRKIAVLGAGGWGTALALVLAHNAQQRVALWSARPDQAREFHRRRENVAFLPGIPIPESILLTTDIREACADCDLIFEAIPTIYLRPTLMRIAEMLPSEVPMVSLTKGLELDTFRRPLEILDDVAGNRPLAVLSGPSHAEEVARRLPASLVAASRDRNLAELVQTSLTTPWFRVYTDHDVIGVELGGALKNILGIAAGICDGLGLGDNAKSALLTRGLVEIARFGVALGAEHHTFWGLAGMGDLITTCFSKHGRNRQVGIRLGQGEKTADILASMTMVAEGVYTARSVRDRARQMNIAMPITDEVYRILYEGKDPRSAVSDLITREPRSEK